MRGGSSRHHSTECGYIAPTATAAAATAATAATTICGASATGVRRCLRCIRETLYPAGLAPAGEAPADGSILMVCLRVSVAVGRAAACAETLDGGVGGVGSAL